MSKTERYRGRGHVPPPGGAMRAKQARRRQTRQADEHAWRDEYQAEEDEMLDEIVALAEHMEDYD